MLLESSHVELSAQYLRGNDCEDYQSSQREVDLII